MVGPCKKVLPNFVNKTYMFDFGYYIRLFNLLHNCCRSQCLKMILSLILDGFGDKKVIEKICQQVGTLKCRISLILYINTLILVYFLF